MSFLPFPNSCKNESIFTALGLMRPLQTVRTSQQKVVTAQNTQTMAVQSMIFHL